MLAQDCCRTACRWRAGRSDCYKGIGFRRAAAGQRKGLLQLAAHSDYPDGWLHTSQLRYAFLGELAAAPQVVALLRQDQGLQPVTAARERAQALVRDRAERQVEVLYALEELAYPVVHVLAPLQDEVLGRLEEALRELFPAQRPAPCQVQAGDAGPLCSVERAQPQRRASASSGLAAPHWFRRGGEDGEAGCSDRAKGRTDRSSFATPGVAESQPLSDSSSRLGQIPHKPSVSSKRSLPRGVWLITLDNGRGEGVADSGFGPPISIRLRRKCCRILKYLQYKGSLYYSLNF
mmetsp:Transcript_8058/g.19254  ORF Transcript_8058/g.19254 Transcript_8058/m.19254 type:complete len:291 (-) Transcript_8058:356-1228(-)